MKSDLFGALAEWTPPVFKILANNDTGNSPGHQAGIVIPVAIRFIFPTLYEGDAKSATIDHWITADLFNEEKYLATIRTRYQYQTWGGTRSPESRLTDSLGPLRNLAHGGDLLLIQKHRLETDKYRLTLLRANTKSFAEFSELTDKQRWGEMYPRNQQAPLSKDHVRVLYIWIEKYKNLHNFGFNFTSDIKFFYDPLKNKISVVRNAELPNDFFPPQISDLIAIVGKNGSGKSNILEMICNVLKGSKDGILSNFFIITQENKSRRYQGYCRFGKNDFPIAINIDFMLYSGDLDPLAVVFFSNVYDERRNNFDRSVIDLSVNGKITNAQLPTSRWNSDFSDQINFLNSQHVNLIDLPPPSAAHLMINAFNWDLGINNLRLDSERLYVLYKHLRRRTRDMQPKNRFISLIRYLYIAAFIDSLQKIEEYGNTEKKIIELIYKQVEKVVQRGFSTEDILVKILESIKNACDTNNLLDSNNNYIFKHPNFSDGYLLKEQFQLLFELPDTADNLEIEHQEHATRSRAQESFLINNTPFSRVFLKKFANTMSFIEFLSIDWLGLSSGQKAYLNLFSKLTTSLGRTYSENVLLCIDEGDLYLHPKWQAEFLQHLLSIISVIQNIKVQLVLTSHSPLLMSDLPRQNVEILGAAEEYDTEIETFGANLYDLYSGPLFLGNLTSGLFANLKLSRLFELARKDKLSAADKKYINDILPFLGDKVLRFKFENLINLKYKS